MKCFNHNSDDAIATCLGCGKGLCRDCCQPQTTDAIVCSDACRQRITGERQMMNLIREKTLRQNTLSGVLLIVAGVIFGLFAVFNLTRPARYYLPLALFLFAISGGFIIVARLFLRVGKEEK